MVRRVIREITSQVILPLLLGLVSTVFRHLQIIFDINLYFLQNVERKFPGDFDKLRRMSIIEESGHKMVFICIYEFIPDL